MKYLPGKMNFVKHKATTKKPKFTVANFEELKAQFLIDIKAVVTMGDVPEDMIINWVQIAVKYIHCPTGLWLEKDPSGLR